MAGQQKQRILTLPLEQFVWFTLGLSQIFCPLCGLSWINLLNPRSIARETWWKTFQDGPFSLKFWHRTMPRRGGRFWGSLTNVIPGDRVDPRAQWLRWGTKSQSMGEILHWSNYSLQSIGVFLVTETMREMLHQVRKMELTPIDWRNKRNDNL